LSALLSVENLKVDIPVANGTLSAVRGVSFTVDRGETLCIVGESGSGKSMSSLALIDLLPRKCVRTADALIFKGEDLLGVSRRRMEDLRGDRMSMIFQEPMTSLNPSLTIGTQLMETVLRHKRTGKAAARDRAVYLLDKVGIPSAEARFRQYPHQLSGGLRQRVMIAMALMCEPELLIADEPTTALDVTIQAQILRVLADLQREFGLALILVTHDLGVVSRIADRVAVMYAGQVVETAPAEALFVRPSHPYTRGLLQCLPTPGMRGPHARLGTIPGMVPAPIGMPPQCAFANRCPDATPLCTGGDIPLAAVATAHESRCLFAERYDNLRVVRPRQAGTS
jgi:peptide/nickel transport system ATP-binding protein